MLDNKNKKVEESAPSKAPAVVGLLKVSDELLDFSSCSVKACPSDCNCKCCQEKKAFEEAKADGGKNLSPRERAILARKKNQ